VGFDVFAAEGASSAFWTLITGAAAFAGGGATATAAGMLGPELGLDLVEGAGAFSATARTSCTFRFAGVNLGSCSFECVRTADAPLAAAAIFVFLLAFFAAAAFRAAALAAFFAAATWATDFTLELVRFRFDNFVTTVFALALAVVVAFRAARVFVAALLLAIRPRALDEDTTFVVGRLDLGFALEAAPVFFVFDFVVFLDLLGATII
jgi:hypothetical protein